MHIKNLKEAEKYLYNTIYLQKFQGKLGLEKTKELAKLLRQSYQENDIWKHLDKKNILNPKIIHIAGTSGKGSTAFILSSLLKNQGFKVGLNISPHLFDIRERFQINNKLISEKLFLKYLNDIIPIIEKIKSTKYEAPTYFEILVILSLYIFDVEKVDYVILETGLGGMYDISNIVENKICILTKIDFDHMNILGKSLKEIAIQKAGIIKSKNLVISINQKKVIEKIIEEKAKKEKSSLYIIKPKKPIFFQNGIEFDFKFKDLILKNLILGMQGIYQIENCSLALTALHLISKRDNFKLNKEQIKKTLKNLNFKGRMEIIKKNDRTIIIDAAHNSNKMKSFIFSVKELYPNQKFNFLIAFREIKDYKKMLKYILEIADKIFITQFSIDNLNFKNFSANPIYIKNQIDALISKSQNKSNISIEVIKDTHTALKKSIHLSNKLIITGSFYLISKIYHEIPE